MYCLLLLLLFCFIYIYSSARVCTLECICISRSSTRESELVTEVNDLRAELSRANELVASLQRKGGDVLPPLEGISAEVAALFKSGMSATHLYSKFVEVGVVSRK